MSQLIPWLTQYEVHVSDIDHQHRELMRMLNELLDATWNGEGKDQIAECLEFLANYTVDHFATEEAYMRTYGFPDYDEHKKVHDEFTAEVTDFIAGYKKTGISTDLLVSVILRLGNWTRDHIRGMDQDLGMFLVAQRSEPAESRYGNRETYVGIGAGMAL